MKIPRKTQIFCRWCGLEILKVVRDIPDWAKVHDTLDYCEGPFKGSSHVDICPQCGGKLESIVTQLREKMVN